MSFFHLPCSCDKITQRRVEWGGGSFERQMNSYTPPGSLRKSMTQGFLDQRPRVDRLLIRPLLIGEMMLSQIVGSFVDVFKNAVELEKKPEKRESTNKLVYPEGEHSFPVS